MFLAAFTSALSAYPQVTQQNRAWLSRLPAAMCPHAEQRWLVYAGRTFSTRPGALSSMRRTSWPHPLARMPRFSPAFCRTLRPGSSALPRAERVMFLIFRSSTRITSKRRARSVEVFSHQSLRRSASQALSRAMASLTCLRRADPRRALASLRSSRRRRCRCRAVSTGQHSSSPVDRAADTATPRSRPTTPPWPGAGTGIGIAANATCQRPAGPCSPGKTSRPAGLAGTSGTAPSPLSVSAPGPCCGSVGARHRDVPG